MLTPRRARPFFRAHALGAVTWELCDGVPLVGRVVGVDVLAVDVLSLGDEGGSAVATLGVALFEAEELDLGGDDVEDVAAHDCGWVVSGGGERERLFRMCWAGRREWRR